MVGLSNFFALTVLRDVPQWGCSCGYSGLNAYILWKCDYNGCVDVQQLEMLKNVTAAGKNMKINSGGLGSVMVFKGLMSYQ